jgi:LysR family hca operon transcriptional activator
MGFLTGHELTWMPEVLQVLRDELPNIDVMISSQYSPQLADALSKGKVSFSSSGTRDAGPSL